MKLKGMPILAEGEIESVHEESLVIRMPSRTPVVKPVL
jgi:hypothetical protein